MRFLLRAGRIWPGVWRYPLRGHCSRVMLIRCRRASPDWNLHSSGDYSARALAGGAILVCARSAMGHGGVGLRPDDGLGGLLIFLVHEAVHRQLWPFRSWPALYASQADDTGSCGIGCSAEQLTNCRMA